MSETIRVYNAEWQAWAEYEIDYDEKTGQMQIVLSGHMYEDYVSPIHSVIVHNWNTNER